MPRYIVTSGSHFEPFSYQELMTPLAQLQSEHNAAQEQYTSLGEQAGLLEQYITDNPDDSEARALYDNYQTKLSRLQEDLWNNGITAGTRRQLADARKTYATDMLRLAGAIKNRQERSQAYWKYKNEHPDALLGADPGASGLNSYLRDQNFGLDYFRYSGDTLTSEVAADAKNRASELLNDQQITKGSGALEGYLRIKERDGYTSQEVSDAVAAVREAYRKNNKGEFVHNPSEYLSGARLSIGAKILADVMYNHIDKTGLVGNADNELERAIEYAAAGVSSAIGKTTTSYMQDLVWRADKELEVAKAKANKKDKEAVQGYTLNDIMQYYESPTFRDYAKNTKRQYKAYESGSKTLFAPDGTSKPVSSAWDMTNEVFNPDIRKQVRSGMGGLDIAMPLESGKQYIIQGIPFVVKKVSSDDALRYGVKAGSLAFYENGNVYNPSVTDKYYESKQSYDAHVKSYKDNNDNRKINWNNDAFTPEKEAKLRKDYNIPDSIDTSDVPSIIETIENSGLYSVPTLVASGSNYNAPRDIFTGNIEDGMIRAKAEINNPETSVFAAYPINKGRLDASKGTVDREKVFGNGKINTLTVDPRDIARGAHTRDGMATVKITTETGLWGVTPWALGSYAGDAVFAGRDTYPRDSFGNWNMCDAVNFMMRPLENPAEVLTWSDEENMAWALWTSKFLNEVNQNNLTAENYRGPAIIGNNGLPVPVFATDVVANKGFQQQLYDGIIRYIRDEIGMVREDLSQNGFQSAGNTSANPAVLNR